MSMSNSHTLFDPSQREVRDRSMSDKSKITKRTSITHWQGLRGWVAQWTLSVVQVMGPLVIIFFVASWIGTGEHHVVGNSCVIFVTEIDLSRIDWW